MKKGFVTYGTQDSKRFPYVVNFTMFPKDRFREGSAHPCKNKKQINETIKYLIKHHANKKLIIGPIQ